MNKSTASLIAAAILDNEDLVTEVVIPLVTRLGGAVRVGRIRIDEVLDLEDEFLPLAKQGHATWCAKWEDEDAAEIPRLYMADYRAIAQALNEKLAPQVLERAHKPQSWSKK